jgi:hypothetical protein
MFLIIQKIWKLLLAGWLASPAFLFLSLKQL